MANLVNTLGGAAGFGEFRLERGDDLSSGFVDLTPLFGPTGINFFGQTFTGLYVNQNGSVSFVRPLPVYKPNIIAESVGNPVIAPFWADIDTRGGLVQPPVINRLVGESENPNGGTSSGSNTVWYDLDAATRTVTVTWDDVGSFNLQSQQHNAFQLSLTQVNDRGDFDIIFRYEQIDWVIAATAGGGMTGRPGVAARAGFSAGDGIHFYELPASGSVEDLLTLSKTSNVGLDGLYRFSFRNGLPTPSLSVGNVEVQEGLAGPGFASVPIYLSGPSEEVVTVRYSTLDATAVGHRDFVPQAGVLTFLPGVTEQRVFIPIIDDDLEERDEGFLIELSEPLGASVGFSTGRVSIVSDDGFSVSALRFLEGTGDENHLVVFAVKLLKPSTVPVTVDYRAVAGTAALDLDFIDTNGTLVFEPGEVLKNVQVPIVPDAQTEEDETFALELFNAEEAESEVIRATATIVDDDGIVIEDLNLVEGSSGTTSGTLRVRLLSALTEPVTVSWTTAQGTARPGFDFVSASGTVTFAPGETLRTIPVTLMSDGIVESVETFRVLLGRGNGATVVDGSATVSILDDDGLTISDATVTEGDSGSLSMEFTVKLESALASTVTVEYATSGGTATGGVDYGHVNGRLKFEPGETQKTLVVPVYGDLLVEGPETVRLVLFNPSANTDLKDGIGIGTVRDNEGLSVIGTDVVEGDGGGRQIMFAVFLNQARPQPVVVRYSTADGTARAGKDYSAVSGLLTFAPGETRKVVPVDVIGDMVFEGPETVRLLLSDSLGAEIAHASGMARIINDDLLPLPTLNISNAAMTEGTGAQDAPMRFLVTLSRPAEDDVIVAYRAIGGTATAGVDFKSVGGLVTIPAGEVRSLIEVPLFADALAEEDESFQILLSEPPAGTQLGVASTATGIILNDDAGPVSSISKARAFLGADDIYTALTPGQSVFGGTGLNVVMLALGAFQVTVNQAIERVVLPGRPEEFLFQQFGNRLAVFEATGAVQLAVLTLQRDLDGTILSFTNGQANARLLADGKMVLGRRDDGVVVGSAEPIRLDPFLDPVPDQIERSSVAKVFLAPGDELTIADRGVSVFGAGHIESVSLLFSASGITTDQLTETIQFPQSSKNYSFLNGGEYLEVYDVAGVKLVASIAVQADSDGTELRFGLNESYRAELAPMGSMRIHDLEVSKTAATTLDLLKDPITQRVLVLDGQTTQVDVSSSDTRLVLPAIGSSFVITVEGFGRGDQIVSPLDLLPSVLNDDYTDGLVILEYAAAGQVVEIHLIGLPAELDAALLDTVSFNQVFGPKALM